MKKEQYNSSEDSSTEQEPVGKKPLEFQILQDLKFEPKLKGFPAGFDFDHKQFKNELSSVGRKARILTEQDKSLQIVNHMLKRLSEDYSIDNPSFFKENSSELSIVLNGHKKIMSSPSKDNRRSSKSKDQPMMTQHTFKKKYEPQKIVSGLPIASQSQLQLQMGKFSKPTFEENEIKRNYKISSKVHKTNEQNSVPKKPSSNLVFFNKMSDSQEIKRRVDLKLTEHTCSTDRKSKESLSGNRPGNQRIDLGVVGTSTMNAPSSTQKRKQIENIKLHLLSKLIKNPGVESQTVLRNSSRSGQATGVKNAGKNSERLLKSASKKQQETGFQRSAEKEMSKGSVDRHRMSNLRGVAGQRNLNDAHRLSNPALIKQSFRATVVEPPSLSHTDDFINSSSNRQSKGFSNKNTSDFNLSNIHLRTLKLKESQSRNLSKPVKRTTSTVRTG
jgi:hypothetical protein